MKTNDANLPSFDQLFQQGGPFFLEHVGTCQRAVSTNDNLSRKKDLKCECLNYESNTHTHTHTCSHTCTNQIGKGVVQQIFGSFQTTSAAAKINTARRANARAALFAHGRKMRAKEDRRG